MSSTGAPCAAASGRIVLARRGEGGYRQYRIPALAAIGDVLLCAYDGRPDLDDLPAPIDLLLRRSTDNGASWSATQVVRAGTGFTGFGDPSLLVDPVTETVLLFHAAGERAGFFESGDGESDEDPDLQHCDLSVSTDAGHTWTHRRLTSSLRHSGNSRLGGQRISGMFAASGAGCAMTTGAFAGRLVQPFVLRIAGRIEVACALSDDHGRTWWLASPIGWDAGERVSGGRAADDCTLNESSVCQLADGSLLLHSRGSGHRLAARSADGGETFGPVEPVADLADPSVNGSVLRVGGTLLASHCADRQLRRHAVVSRSDDGGASWRVLRTLEPGSSGYTQLAALPDGRVGVAYEADGYSEIRFEAFDLDPVTGAVAASPADQPTPLACTSTGWARVTGSSLVLDLVLRAVVSARPAVWVESGPTHAIDLSAFAAVDAAVFKEIGQDRSTEAVQVLRTRESLAANLGPVEPGIRAGDTLEVHARLRNDGRGPAPVAWDGETRIVAPGEHWLRRDLVHVVSPEEVTVGTATVTSAVDLIGAPAGARTLAAVLTVPTR